MSAGTCASACRRSRVTVTPCSTAPSSTRSICATWYRASAALRAACASLAARAWAASASVAAPAGQATVITAAPAIITAIGLIVSPCLLAWNSLPLIHAHQVIERLALLEHLDAQVVLHGAQAAV